MLRIIMFALTVWWTLIGFISFTTSFLQGEIFWAIVALVSCGGLAFMTYSASGYEGREDDDDLSQLKFD